MTQSIKQREDLQLHTRIGAKYAGPAFDRPALRQMPRDWQLSEPRVNWPAIRVIGWTAALILVGVMLALWVGA